MINCDDVRFTVARLRNIPVFCVGRVYKISQSVLDTPRYEFEFDNGYGASVIIDFGTEHPGEVIFELAVLLHDNVCYDTAITRDIERGIELEIDSLLDRISMLDEL